MFHWKNKVIFIAKLVKAKIFIRDIKVKLEEINSQFRNKKNYQPATHTKKDNTITPCYLFLYTFHQKSRHPYVLF